MAGRLTKFGADHAYYMHLNLYSPRSIFTLLHYQMRILFSLDQFASFSILEYLIMCQQL